MRDTEQERIHISAKGRYLLKEKGKEKEKRGGRGNFRRFGRCLGW